MRVATSKTLIPAIFSWAFLFCSCNSTLLTTPLCGPNSIDQRPVSTIPDTAVGCYEVATMNLSSGNVFTSKTSDPSYVWIGKNGRNETEFRISPGAKPLLKSIMSDKDSVPICDVPLKNANPNARIIMTYENGWYGITEYTFDTSRNIISVGSYEIAAENIKKSGIRYVVFPKWNGTLDDRPAKYPITSIFSPSIDVILVDNSQLTPEMLFERLQIRRSSVVFEIPRVDPRKCATRGMTNVSL